MQLSHCTWCEVEVYLRGSVGLILPIGSTEQHGPTGLMGTDAICAREIARRSGDQLRAMVAPTISVGVAEHHMGFPGTISYTPSLLIRIITEQIMSLAVHGFRRVLLVNGHGGNVPSILAAFTEIYAASRHIAGPDLRCRLVNWWDPPGVGEAVSSAFGEANGDHATASEIAITRYLYPERRGTMPLEPAIAPVGRFYGAADFRRRFPDGRVGSNPGLATAELGEVILAAAVAGVVAAYDTFMSEDKNGHRTTVPR